MADMTLEAVAGELKITGIINEDAVFTEVFSGEGPLTIDMSGVQRINSCGVREWIEALRGITSRPVTLKNCSIAIVEQLSMVANFSGHADVESFFAPYTCETCGDEKEILLTVAEHGATCSEASAPVINCPTCNNPLEFDEDEDEYFMFLEG